MRCQGVTAIRLDGDHLTAIPLRCKCWSCKDCAPLRRRKLVGQILSGAPFTFLTLTWRTRPNFTPNQAAQLMSKAFSKLAKNIRRHWPQQPFEYACVWEATKQGQPHLHIVARAPYIPQHWLSQEWGRLTGSYIVDIRAIQDAYTAAKYVSKYVTKAPHHFDGTKRYRFSYGYMPQDDASHPALLPPESGWQYALAPLSTLRPALNAITIPETAGQQPHLFHAPLDIATRKVLDGLQMNSPERLTAALDSIRPYMLLGVLPHQLRLQPALTPSGPPLAPWSSKDERRSWQDRPFGTYPNPIVPPSLPIGARQNLPF